MDLLSIVRKVWHYRVLTVPVMVLTFLGAAYVVAVKDPVYEASSSYILINPPPPPTEQEIARDPTLRDINADNPFTRFTDQSVVVQVLASSLNTESARDAMVEAGADRRYTVERSSEFGYSSPIVQITGRGDTSESATRTAELVGDAVTDELARLQEARGVADDFMIKTQQVDAPDGAELRATGQLRVLVGILALGTFALFVVVSVADAVTALRSERGSDSRGPDEDQPGADRRDRLDDHPPGLGSVPAPVGASAGPGTNGHGRARYKWSAETWLEAFSRTSSVAEACRAVGIVESTAYRRRRNDPYFAERWDAVDQAAAAGVAIVASEHVDPFPEWSPEPTVSSAGERAGQPE